MKRFVTCLFVFAAMVAATPVFTGCSDLSDDVESLENRVSTLESQVQELQKLMSAVNSNLYIKSVEVISNGYILHLSDGSSATVTNGSDGVDGDSIFKGVDLSDPDYVVINMTDGTVISIPTFEPVAITVEGAENGLLTVENGMKISVKANVKESEFSALAAEIRSNDGNAISIVTKADNAWSVEASSPTFGEDGLSAELTVSTSDITGDKALLTITLVQSNGKKSETTVVLTCQKAKKLQIVTFEGEYWNGLIDTPQYGGPLLYGESGYGMEDCDYYWSDPVTLLSSELVYSWGSYAYWNGGHAISNYVDGELSNGDYNHQLTVYKKGAAASQKGGGHNGSDNFCMHYGYIDSMGYSDTLPMFYFSDGEARVIDHMWVNNSLYAINTYIDGNSLSPKISENDWVKIVATGTDAEGQTKTAEFYLCNGPEDIITEWTKWDLSSLGAVVAVEFNVTGSSDNGSGFSQPAYFAYDDVAIVVD